MKRLYAFCLFNIFLLLLSMNVNASTVGDHVHNFDGCTAYEDPVPTCISEGKLHEQCTICYEYITVTSPVDPYRHEWDIYCDPQPTCIQLGKEWRVCRLCHEKSYQEVSDLGNHRYEITAFERGYVTPSLPTDTCREYCSTPNCTASRVIGSSSLSLKLNGNNIFSIIPKKASSLGDIGNTYSVSCAKGNYTVIPIVLSNPGSLNIKLSFSDNNNHPWTNLYSNINWLIDKNKAHEKEQSCIDLNTLSYNRTRLNKGTYYLVAEPSQTNASFTVSCSINSAEDNTLVENKTYTVSGNPWHKIIIPKRGYISLECHPKFNTITFNLYNKNKLKYSRMFAQYDAYGFNPPTQHITVEAGTYYLRMDNPLNPCDYSIKYTFHPTKALKNVSKAKAQTIKKNQIVTTYAYTKDKKSKWSHYYKIKLTKKQRVYVYMDQRWPSSVNIYDSKMRWIKMPSKELKNGRIQHYTRKVLKKGTYYILFGTDFRVASTRKNSIGYITKFSWK